MHKYIQLVYYLDMRTDTQRQVSTGLSQSDTLNYEGKIIIWNGCFQIYFLDNDENIH